MYHHLNNSATWNHVTNTYFIKKVLKLVLFDFKKFLMYPDTDKGSIEFNSWFEHVSRNWSFLQKSPFFENFEILDC